MLQTLGIVPDRKEHESSQQCCLLLVQPLLVVLPCLPLGSLPSSFFTCLPGCASLPSVSQPFLSTLLFCLLSFFDLRGYKQLPCWVLQSLCLPSFLMMGTWVQDLSFISFSCSFCLPFLARGLTVSQTFRPSPVPHLPF